MKNEVYEGEKSSTERFEKGITEPFPNGGDRSFCRKRGDGFDFRRALFLRAADFDKAFSQSLLQ